MIRMFVVSWTPSWPPECTGQKLVVTGGGQVIVNDTTLAPTDNTKVVELPSGLAVVGTVTGFNENADYPNPKTLSFGVVAAQVASGGGLTFTEQNP
jgi:hypothetical protein